MYLKVLFNSLLIFLLFAIQVAFISALPGWLSSLNLVLVVLVYMLVDRGFNLTISWAIALGFLFDTLSFSIFGLHILSISFTVLIVAFLLNNFLTNRSVYSLAALTASMTIMYSVLIFIGGSVGGLLMQQVSLGITKYYWVGMIEQLALNLIVTIVLFYFLNYIGGRFKPVFLSRRRQKF